MTLIIGVLCDDGVVVGADSIATFGSEIEQEVSYKIEIYEEDIAIATSGDVGVSQLLKQQLGPRWHEIKLCTDVLDVKNLISSEMWKQIEPAVNRAKFAQAGFGGCETIVALPVNGVPKLLHFGTLSDPFEINADTPFISIGSGRRQADPFLAFIKRLFWHDSTPASVLDGIFGIVWTLQHVSRVNAGLGIGGRHRIAVLQRPNASWIAEMLSEPHLMEYVQAIDETEGALRDYRARFGSIQLE